jgi:preprotein translocase subunit YajC
MRIIHWLSLLIVSITLLCLVSCVPAGESAAESPFGGVTMIIFVVVIMGMLYFMMIRPQRKRMKEQQQFMAALKRGDRVITVAGIYGEIESLDKDSAVLKVESGTTIRVTRSSITTKRNQ